MFESNDDIVFIVVGAILILLGVTGLASKSKRSQWLVNSIGPAGVRIFYAVLGIIFIVLGIFVVK